MRTRAIGKFVRVSCAAFASCASFAVLADPPADVMNIVREADIKRVGNPLIPGEPYASRSGLRCGRDTQVR